MARWYESDAWMDRDLRDTVFYAEFLGISFEVAWDLGYAEALRWEWDELFSHYTHS